MATYNGEAHLEEQLQSIVDQDYSNYELLIGDDNSTDGTYGIVASYAEKYDWIQVTQNNKRLGLIKNFEALLESAKGDYIAFSDQDDVWHREKLSRSVEALEDENEDKPMLLHSDLLVVGEKLEPLHGSFFSLRGYDFGEERQLEAMLGRCGVMGNTMMINRQLKSLVLPFPEYLSAHDYWIALVNELFGKRITLRDTLVNYRIHDANSSNSAERIRQSRCRVASCLRRDYRLPFIGTGREKVLSYLLEHYPPKPEDRKKIGLFMDYLAFKKSRLFLAGLILRYDFLKNDWPYRMKVAWKIMWKKR